MRCEGDVLSLIVNGREVGSMIDGGVRESLMRMFLGEQLFLPDVKKSVSEGLTCVLVDSTVSTEHWPISHSSDRSILDSTERSASGLNPDGF